MAKKKETSQEKALRLAELSRTFDALTDVIEDEIHLVIVNILEDFSRPAEAGPEITDLQSFARDRAKRLARSHCGFHTGVGGRAAYLKALRGFWHEARFSVLIENSEQLTLVPPPTASPAA